jgi:hypothetical protein
LLVLPPFHTPQSSYNIYTDDIKNISHPRLTQQEWAKRFEKKKLGVSLEIFEF